MKRAAVLSHSPFAHIQHLIIQIQSHSLYIREIEQRLALIREAKIPLPVPDILALIESIDKIPLQPFRRREIIGFLIGSSGPNIAV